MSRNNSRTAGAAAANKISKYTSKAEDKAGRNNNLKDVKQTNQSNATIGIKTAEESMTANREDNKLQEKLQEAVIWTEILGKPLSKRRKRR
jgi:Cu/Ag efflux pump CusA